MSSDLAGLANAVDDGRAAPATPSPRILVGREWNPAADPLWQRILTEVCGVNLYGDPYLRIVNGSSRLELIGGLWDNNEWEDAGLPSLRCQWDQKYPWLEEFWIVEEWTPTLVSRETWERQERQCEDGVTFLSHPLYPERGEYRYYTHFRRKGSDGEEEPQAPTPSALRIIASGWRLAREKFAPAVLEASAAQREKRIRANEARAKERRLRREADTKKKKRDIWENEVGGLTGFTPRVSLAGLDVPTV